jgi:hypothetical protein
MYRRVRLQGRTLGWMFEQKPGKRAKFGRYQDYFRLLVEREQEEDQKLMPNAVETLDFSLWHSLWGAVLETTTHKVDAQVIKLVNQWRKKEAAWGSKAGLPMRQVYTQVRSALPTMKEFLRAL